MRRIVCLVPSLSELVAKIFRKEEFVGCTKFCIKPSWLKNLEILGGTKDFNLHKIRDLNPTHIIANREENSKNLVEEIMQEYKTIVTSPDSPQSVVKMFQDLSFFLDSEILNDYAERLQKELDAIKSMQIEHKSYVYLIWRNPWMAVGSDTYISNMLKLIGFSNDISEKRYPMLQDEIKINADVVFFPNEPWKFRHRDIDAFCRHFSYRGLCVQVDGRMISWFGLSTFQCLEEFNRYLKTGVSQIFKNYEAH